MKSPRIAAAVLVLPMLAALAGIVVSLKSVSAINYCLSFTKPVSYTVCEIVVGGLTQYSK